jgi:hypothetical protein
MHRAKFTMVLRICSHWAGVGPLPPFGSRWRHALWAAGNRGLLSETCFALGGNTPLLLGSGQFGTPCKRTQWAKATMECVDPAACGEPPELVDDGLPLHAAAGRARAAVVMRAAAVRAARGDGRCGRGMTRASGLDGALPDRGGAVRQDGAGTG